MNLDPWVNDFAIRSFRDTADGDYIVARLAYRARLIPQFLWSSLQAIEKYLKCILVLNRIPAPRGHDLSKILEVLESNIEFKIRLSERTRDFLRYLDTYGRHRYFETPYYTMGCEVFELDYSVWEIRRYARVMDQKLKISESETVELLDLELEANEKAEQRPRHLFRIMFGRLEKIIDSKDHPSREPLLWQNAFFGKKNRKTVTLPTNMESANSPLALHPELLDEIQKYVFLPADVKKAYREILQEKQADNKHEE